MTNLIQFVVSNYNEVLKHTKDPMIDSWFLMESSDPMLYILGAYLIFVLKIGPKIMEKRPAFQLNTFMILYNAFQVLFNAWIVRMFMDVDFKYIFSGCSQNRLSPYSHNIQMISRATWWYFFSKIIELLDTVFFVLRKKQKQISFLHVYHHVSIVVTTWCYLKFLPGEQGMFLGILNSSVHVIMYSYYFIAALGPKYKKYLWWKKYMTSIQLMQFALMLVYLTLILIMNCRIPKALTYLLTIYIISMVYLFSDFYYQAYKKKIT